MQFETEQKLVSLLVGWEALSAEMAATWVQLERLAALVNAYDVEVRALATMIMNERAQRVERGH